MAMWGQWDDELVAEVGETEVARLTLAYMRRVRWEARVLAVEVVGALGEAMGGGGRSGGRRLLRPGERPRNDRVSGEALMGAMGARFG